MDFFKQKKVVVYLSFLVLAFLYSKQSKAQNNASVDSLILFELTNGQRIAASVIHEDEREFVVLTTRGSRDTIAKYRILNHRNANKSDLVGGKLIFKNDHPATYYYSPSAVPLKNGTGYLSFPIFFACKSQYAFSDHFSMGITTSVVLYPFILNARYAKNISKDVYVAIGTDYFKTDWYNPSELNGNINVTITKGSTENNFSVSLGKGLVYEPEKTKHSELISLSGIKRISPKKNIMGECIFLFRDGPAMTIVRAGGIRVSRGKKATWDIGLFSLLEKRLVQGEFNSNSKTWDYKYA